MTKYVCKVCGKIEWSTGYPNQASSGTHPRVCIHGDNMIVMDRK